MSHANVLYVIGHTVHPNVALCTRACIVCRRLMCKWVVFTELCALHGVEMTALGVASDAQCEFSVWVDLFTHRVRFVLMFTQLHGFCLFETHLCISLWILVFNLLEFALSYSYLSVY